MYHDVNHTGNHLKHKVKAKNFITNCMSHTSLPFCDTHIASSIEELKVFWELLETRISSQAKPPWFLIWRTWNSNSGFILRLVSYRTSRDVRQVESKFDVQFSCIPLLLLIYTLHVLLLYHLLLLSWTVYTFFHLKSIKGFSRIFWIKWHRPYKDFNK